MKIENLRKYFSTYNDGIIYDKWNKLDCVTTEYKPSNDKRVKFIISTAGTYKDVHPFRLTIHVDNKPCGIFIFKTKKEAEEYITSDIVKTIIAEYKFDMM